MSYYYSLLYAEIILKNGITLVKNWSKWSKATSDQSGERLWGKKVHQKSKSVWGVFGTGSDIKDNYPILFGIKKFEQTAKLPKIMAKYEVRLIEPVELSDLSHIEVPENKIFKVKSLLQKSGYSIPVFPIELGEYVASKQRFAELLGIRKEKK